MLRGYINRDGKTYTIPSRTHAASRRSFINQNEMHGQCYSHCEKMQYYLPRNNTTEPGKGSTLRDPLKFSSLYLRIICNLSLILSLPPNTKRANDKHKNKKTQSCGGVHNSLRTISASLPAPLGVQEWRTMRLLTPLNKGFDAQNFHPNFEQDFGSLLIPKCHKTG